MNGLLASMLRWLTGWNVNRQQEKTDRQTDRAASGGRNMRTKVKAI